MNTELDPQKTAYRANPNLKRAGVKMNFTQDQLKEYIKCSEDPIYFIENYFKIVTLDKGLINISLYDYQKDIIRLYHENRFVIIKASRQSAKCFKHSTFLNIRNKKTGEIRKISVGELYNEEKFKNE